MPRRLPLSLLLLLSLLVIPSLFAQKSKPPALVSTGGCDPKRFLIRAYQDLLGRPLDPGGESYWMGVMKNGASRTQVASQLMRSAEYANGRVQALYNAYLHRPPDGSGLASLSGMLQHGATEEQVESSILASNEYFTQRGRGTNQGFIAALYPDVLGRAADPQAIAAFTQQLGAGSSRAAIAQQVLTSPEARQRWISALYAKYLHRAAPRTPSFGGEEQVAANIIGSDDYCRQ